MPLVLPEQVVLGGAEIPTDDMDGCEGKLAAVRLNDGASIFKRVGFRLPGTLGHLRQFETIGGLGASLVVSTQTGEPADRVPLMVSARKVVGVLFEAGS